MESLKVYFSSQVVPNKGMSYTYYETDGEGTVQRILTHLPETGEITLYPKPRMKQLFEPERLQTSDIETFEKLWQEGS